MTGMAEVPGYWKQYFATEFLFCDSLEYISFVGRLSEVRNYRYFVTLVYCQQQFLITYDYYMIKK